MMYLFPREKIIQEPELKVGGFAGWRHRQAKVYSYIQF